LMLSVNI